MTTPKMPDNLPRMEQLTPVGQDRKELPAEPFKAYMQEAQPNPLLGNKTAQVSPFDLAHGQVPASGPTMNTLLAQAAQAQTTLGDLNTQLNTPGLKLKQSSKYLLKNKLTNATEHLRSASTKLGVQQKVDNEEEKKQTPGGPLQKFLAMVTDGQYQMEGAQRMLQGLKDKGDNISPADMLLVQIKLNKAQQELEYSSVLLSKAMDDIKMLMNIQL